PPPPPRRTPSQGRLREGAPREEQTTPRSTGHRQPRAMAGGRDSGRRAQGHGLPPAERHGQGLGPPGPGKRESERTHAGELTAVAGAARRQEETATRTHVGRKLRTGAHWAGDGRREGAVRGAGRELGAQDAATGGSSAMSTSTGGSSAASTAGRDPIAFFSLFVGPDCVFKSLQGPD
uniref:Uncharacterized protein n=1 Tax=Aegilops tauschii subsp. strangulata TaxID=200361 RepID=A0A453EAE2_AEGTS